MTRRPRTSASRLRRFALASAAAASVFVLPACATTDTGAAQSWVRGGPIYGPDGRPVARTAAAPAPKQAFRPQAYTGGLPAGAGLMVWTDAGWRDSVVSSRLPKCAKANNYWCVKTPGSDNWQGQVGEDERRHAQFAHPAYSARAFIRLMHTYRYKHGITTLRGIVYRYAPPGQCVAGSYRDPRTGLCPDGSNSPSTYAAWVADQIGVGLDDRVPLFVDEHTVNADWMAALAINMAAYEMGRQYRPHPTLVEDGIRLAGLEIEGGAWLCAEAQNVIGPSPCRLG